MTSPDPALQSATMKYHRRPFFFLSIRSCFMLVLVALCSCVHHGKDRELVSNQAISPAAYGSHGKKPYLRKWADFDVLQNAAVEMEHLTNWDGKKAVAGNSMVIKLSEGSRLENTTAHPQYFELWIQIPQNLPLHKPYPLYPAAQIRETTRQVRWPSGDITKYSRMKEGEMTLSGMQGYDCPRLCGSWRSVATLTIISRSNDHLTFRLTGVLPIRQDGMRMNQKYEYALKVDRDYKAVFKPVKG